MSHCLFIPILRTVFRVWSRKYKLCICWVAEMILTLFQYIAATCCCFARRKINGARKLFNLSLEYYGAESIGRAAEMEFFQMKLYFAFPTNRLERKKWSISEGHPFVPENSQRIRAYHLQFNRLNRKFWLTGKHSWYVVTWLKCCASVTCSSTKTRNFLTNWV